MGGEGKAGGFVTEPIPAYFGMAPSNDNDGACVFCTQPTLPGQPVCLWCDPAWLLEAPHAR